MQIKAAVSIEAKTVIALINNFFAVSAILFFASLREKNVNFTQSINNLQGNFVNK